MTPASSAPLLPEEEPLTTAATAARSRWRLPLLLVVAALAADVLFLLRFKPDPPPVPPPSIQSTEIEMRRLLHRKVYFEIDITWPDPPPAPSPPLPPPPPPLAALPLQVHDLLKIVGDDGEDGFLLESSGGGRGRTIVYVSTASSCERTHQWVTRGFVVHAFNPLPDTLAHCKDSLHPTQWYEVPCAGGVPNLDARPHSPRVAPGGTGMAFLYQAAVGDTRGTASMRTSHSGHEMDHSSGHDRRRLRERRGLESLDTGAPSWQAPRASTTSLVPVVRLDDCL